MSSYPLGQSEADTITSRTGKKLSQITLDEVKKNVRVETGSGAWSRSWILLKQKMDSLFPDLTMKKTVRRDLNRERYSVLSYPEESILQTIRMIPIQQSYRSTRNRWK